MQAAFLINFWRSDSPIARGQSDTLNAVRGVTEKPNRSWDPVTIPVGPAVSHLRQLGDDAVGRDLSGNLVVAEFREKDFCHDQALSVPAGWIEGDSAGWHNLVCPACSYAFSLGRGADLVFVRLCVMDSHGINGTRPGAWCSRSKPRLSTRGRRRSRSARKRRCTVASTSPKAIGSSSSQARTNAGQVSLRAASSLRPKRSRRNAGSPGKRHV